MRTLMVLLVLGVLVASAAVSAKTTEPEDEAFEAKPALTVSFEASLPIEDPLLENSMSLIDQLRSLSNIDGFEFQLRMYGDRDYEVYSKLGAWFSFDTTSELAEWERSDSVKAFLSSVEQASGERPKLSVRGKLLSE